MNIKRVIVVFNKLKTQLTNYFVCSTWFTRQASSWKVGLKTCLALAHDPQEKNSNSMILLYRSVLNEKLYIWFFSLNGTKNEGKVSNVLSKFIDKQLEYAYFMFYNFCIEKNYWNMEVRFVSHWQNSKVWVCV